MRIDELGRRGQRRADPLELRFEDVAPPRRLLELVGMEGRSELSVGGDGIAVRGLDNALLLLALIEGKEVARGLS
jgi:hypothetical protein